jgi:UPF0271 protein
MRAVIDTSLFFIEFPIPGEMYTPPSVIDELVDLRSKCRYETLLASGLLVVPPTKESSGRVSDAAEKTGDADRISDTDRDILALALDLSATIYTDDFAVHNVAHELGIATQPIQQRRAKKRAWKFCCTGCRRFYRASGECPVCGSPIKRTIK